MLPNSSHSDHTRGHAKQNRYFHWEFRCRVTAEQFSYFFLRGCVCQKHSCCSGWNGIMSYCVLQKNDNIHIFLDGGNKIWQPCHINFIFLNIPSFDSKYTCIRQLFAIVTVYRMFVLGILFAYLFNKLRFGFFRTSSTLLDYSQTFDLWQILNMVSVVYWDKEDDIALILVSSMEFLSIYASRT